MAKDSLDPHPSTPANANVNFSKCFFYHKEETTGKLTQFTAISWQTSHKAAKERGYKTYKQCKNIFEKGALGVYHRSYYQAYRNQDHIARFKRQRKEIAIESVAD